MARTSRRCLPVIKSIAGLALGLGLAACAVSGDRDYNPPGPAGGPGTNWENPPGPIGGPGASQNRRACR